MSNIQNQVPNKHHLQSLSGGEVRGMLRQLVTPMVDEGSSPISQR